MGKILLSSKEVSKYLSIPLRTLQHLSKDGKIKAIKIGKYWKYKKSDIEQYLNYGTDFSKEPQRIHNNINERSDRRAYPRINTNFKCLYTIKLPPFKNINGEGIIKDLSAGGIFLFDSTDGIRESNINDPIELDFNLIKKAETVRIEAGGRIVRKQDNGLGIKFRNIPRYMKKEIIRHVG